MLRTDSPEGDADRHFAALDRAEHRQDLIDEIAAPRAGIDERTTREAFDAVMVEARAEFARRGELDAFARGQYCGRINVLHCYGRGIGGAEFSAASDELIAMRERVRA